MIFFLRLFCSLPLLNHFVTFITINKAKDNEPLLLQFSKPTIIQARKMPNVTINYEKTTSNFGAILSPYIFNANIN